MSKFFPPDTIADEQLLNSAVIDDCVHLLNQLREQTFINPSGEAPDRIENIHAFLDEELAVWSPLQKSIIAARLEGKPIAVICEEMKLSSDAVVLRIIKRALTGNSWDAFTTGRLPVISEVQELFIKSTVTDRADALNSIDTNELISIIEDINARYLHRAYMLAILLNHPVIASELLTMHVDISYQWLFAWTKKNQFELKSPQKLVYLRRKYCHANVLAKFYAMLSTTLHQIPELLFNADESALAINTGGKVIVPKGAFPTKTTIRLASHYSVMCCFNAVGYTMPPFIIIPNCKSLPADLRYFDGSADFAIGPNGWMSSKIFLTWAILFCRRLSTYRLQLHDSIRNQACFLIMDGHKSRLNSEAIELFSKHNIRVIILPAHSSHCTQPFDVGLALPFKTRLKQLYASLPEKIVTFVFNRPGARTSAAAYERFELVYAVIDAWRVASTKRNCESAWMRAGLYPLNAAIVLQRNDVLDTGTLDERPPTKGIDINGMEITTDDKRIELASKYFNIKINTVDQIPKCDEQEIIKRLSKQTSEKLVSSYPTSIQEIPGPEGTQWSLAIITRN